jgi:hypothetical protein
VSGNLCWEGVGLLAVQGKSQWLFLRAVCRFAGLFFAVFEGALAEGFAAALDFARLGASSSTKASRLRRPISSAIYHMALPRGAACFDIFSSSSPASDAS